MTAHDAGTQKAISAKHNKLEGKASAQTIDPVTSHHAMIFAKRIALLAVSFTVLLIYYQLRSRDYGAALVGLSQTVGLGEYYLHDDEGQNVRTPVGVNTINPAQNLEHADPGRDSDAETKKHNKFPPPVLRPAGDNYTKAVIIGKLSSENTSWLEDADLLGVRKYIYTVDNHHTPLHTAINKGHEVIPYLTYILEHYDDPDLADVNIFLHAHRSAWHTPELLNHDALQVITRLSSPRVTREGYTNLRCYWDPGCPTRIYPGRIDRDKDRPEQLVMAATWPLLFPGEPVPSVLGAPCCGQFAVSAQRLRAIPKARFQRYYDWTLSTRESDWVSGRVFEYLWQKIFTGEEQVCPDARACYCDGYGICFAPDNFEAWFAMKARHDTLDKELRAWIEKDGTLEAEAGYYGGSLRALEAKELEIPSPGLGKVLRDERDKLYGVLGEMREEALRNGSNPRLRAQAAGRPWKEGDGF